MTAEYVKELESDIEILEADLEKQIENTIEQYHDMRRRIWRGWICGTLLGAFITWLLA